MIYNETKFNKNWETKKLEELGMFSRGKSKHRPRNDEKLFEGGGYPLVQTGDIKNANLYVSKHTSEYNEFGLSQSKLWDKDTLCITIAANIAETAILKYPMCFPDSIVGFNANKEVCTELFMHYIFTYIKQSIQNSVSGSIQDNINIEYLKNLDFKIPNLDIQNRITSILGSLDKKIENNNETKKELEEYVRVIYRYYFLQYEFPDETNRPFHSNKGNIIWNTKIKKKIPEDWQVKNISEILVEMPKSTIQVNQVKENNIGNYPFFTSGEEVLKTDIIQTEGKRCFIGTGGSSNPKFFMGKAAYSTDTWCLSTHNDLDFYFYLWIDSFGEEFDKIYFAGTGLQHLQKDLFRNTSILIPSEKIIKKFNKLVEPSFCKISEIYFENEELKKIRDVLNPLLMNGQVKFKTKK